MNKLLIVTLGAVAILVGCSSGDQSVVVVDLSQVSAAIASGGVFGPGEGGSIEVTVKAPGKGFVAGKTYPLGTQFAELDTPAGTGMAVGATVSESDAFGETVYYSGSTVADLLPGARNAVELALVPAVAVEPRAASVKLGQSAVFSAAAAALPDEGLVWQVNGVLGGDASVGVVTQTNPATYYAPNTAPAAPVVVSASFAVDTTTFVGGAFVTLTDNDLLPAISDFSPASGPPGTLVSITGANFGTDGNVLFGGVTADSIPSWTDRAISAVVPVGASTGPITVRTSEGTAESAANFTVTYPTPVISGFSPASGAPGTAVTVTGKWFGALQGTSGISFGGVKAETVYVWSETELRAAVPEGAVSGKISVKTEWGTAESQTSFAVLLPAPVISGFSPAAGLPGDEVTVTGRDFGGGDASSAGFGGAGGPVAASATAWADTEIKLVVPDAAVSGPLWVTTPGGTAESADAFTVKAPAPVISGLTPALTSDNTPGFSLTVTGRWFVAGSVVEFGGNRAETTFKSDKDLAATITDDMVGIPGDVAVTVTNPDGEASAVHTFRVYAGSALSFSSVTTGAPAVSSGQAAVPVVAKVKNDGEAPAKINSLSLALSGQSGQDVAGDFTVSPQFRTPEFLAGGSEKSFAFTLGYSSAPAYSGAVTLTPVISATDGYSGVALSPAAAQATFAAQKAAAVAVRQIAVEGSGKATLGQTKKVTVTFENTGEAGASITAAALVFADAGGKNLGADFSATTGTLFPADLSGGASLPVEFAVQTNVAGQPGAVTIDVAAAAIDANTRAVIQVAPPATKGSLTTQTPPALSFSGFSLSKSVVNMGQTGLSLSATVHNAGEADAAIVSVEPEFKDAGSVDVTADYVITPTDLYPVTVPGGADAVLGFQVSVKPGAAKGVVTAGVKKAAATDANTGSSATVSGTPAAQWTVQSPASLNILNVTSSQGIVHVLDSGLSLAVTVENTGDSSAKVTAAAVKFTQGANDVTSVFAPVLQTALPAAITGQSLQQFTFPFGAPMGAPVGTTVIDASVTFEDVVSGATESRPAAQSPATVEVRHKLTVTVNSPASWVYAGGAEVQLSYTVKDENGNDPANTGVTWSVEGGLPVEVGTISGTGLYVPPAKALKGTATIRATSAEDAAFSATTDIDLRHVLTVAVTPSAKDVYVNGATTQFSAVVKDETDAVHATPVTWSVQGGTAAEVGSIDPATGVYSAPSKWWVGSGTVRATSQEDNTFSGTSTLTFKHTYAVDILPKDVTVYVRAAPIQFNATVLDDGGQAAPQGVTWSVEGGTALQVGTIDTVSGMYTPPSNMTISVATIRATSKDDSAFSSTTSVNLKHILTVNVTPSAPGIHTGKTRQFTAEVRDEANALHGTGVAWSLVEAGNVGSIDPLTGLYTAPVLSPDPGVTVKAVSIEDPTASGTSAVTLWDGPPGIFWESAPTRLNPGQGAAFMASVTNATDTSAAFYVNGVAGGNADLGLIDAGGNYQAPSILPPSPTVTVKAVSNEDQAVFIERVVVVAVGTYISRFRLAVDEVGRTLTPTQLDGSPDISIVMPTFGNLTSCGAQCSDIDVFITPQNNSSTTTYEATAVSYAVMPAQMTPTKLNGGTSAGPIGCAQTATVFGGYLAPMGQLYNMPMNWRNESAAQTYDIDVEIAWQVPYLDLTGPFGGVLNDPVVLTGGYLGDSPLAAVGNKVTVNSFQVPEGSVTKWSQSEIDFAVPVGASTGPLVTYVAAFPALNSQPFSFGRQAIIDTNLSFYNGGDFWVPPTESSIFYSGANAGEQIGLYYDAIPPAAPLGVQITGSPIGAIHVSGSNLFYGSFFDIYLKSTGDQNPGQLLDSGTGNQPENGMVAAGNLLFYAANPDGSYLTYGDYTTAFSPTAGYLLLGGFLYGMDATPDGKIVFGDAAGPSMLKWADSADPVTATDIVAIPDPAMGYRAFWLNAAGDSLLFQYDNGVDGPGIYVQTIVSGTPAKVLPLAATGTPFAAAVTGTKLNYIIDDTAAGYVMLKWKEIGGAGGGTLAYVAQAGNVPKFIHVAGGNVYYGCMGSMICRSALAP
ncbi:MAG: IPT/TIG domain-containing protein [Deltaproteobacteria bacterium]|nr:IPT/TIG domain-containing protein [Deltaproteobacteria bacterium]